MLLLQVAVFKSPAGSMHNLHEIKTVHPCPGVLDRLLHEPRYSSVTTSLAGVLRIYAALSRSAAAMQTVSIGSLTVLNSNLDPF